MLSQLLDPDYAQRKGGLMILKKAKWTQIHFDEKADFKECLMWFFVEEEI